MYVKLINPKTHGKAAYNNEESCAPAVHYLLHEAQEEGAGNDIFFNQDQDTIDAEIVQNAIDTNCKGLRKSERKFYSLILAPSQNELQHIQNRADLLKAYTREVMQLYAQNFKLKEGIQLESKDLVWFAAIHRERAYRGTDADVRAGKAAVGERRPGLQTHVHILVSARDKEQQLTLNPGGRRSRFNLMHWQTAAGKQFEAQFQYVALDQEKVKAKTRDSSRDAARAFRIGERVAHLNILIPKAEQLDIEKVQRIAAKREYDKTFYRSLKHLENAALLGLPLHHPYHFLKTGREKHIMPRTPHVQGWQLLRAMQATVQASVQNTKTEEIGEGRRTRTGELEIE